MFFGHGVAPARRHGRSAPSSSVVTSGDSSEHVMRLCFMYYWLVLTQRTVKASHLFQAFDVGVTAAVLLLSRPRR